MEPKELPDNIQLKVDEWTGGHILHWWQSNNTFYVVVLSESKNVVMFLRLFTVGNEVMLSQDNSTEI